MSARAKIDCEGETLIAALLTEPTHAFAAAKAGVSEATVQRWQRKPDSLTAYRLARRAVVESAVGRLQQVTGEAVEVLRRNLTCGTPAVEIRAAVAILDNHRKSGSPVQKDEGLRYLHVQHTSGCLAALRGEHDNSWL